MPIGMLGIKGENLKNTCCKVCDKALHHGHYHNQAPHKANRILSPIVCSTLPHVGPYFDKAHNRGLYPSTKYFG